MSRVRVLGSLAAVASVALVVGLMCWPRLQTPAGRWDAARAHGRVTRQSARADTVAHTSARSCDPTASLRPMGPPVVASGSFMAKIRTRGYLIAGVDQSTYHFGYLNPFDGQLQGFDIDMVRAVAQAIFGNPDKVRFVVVSDAQRLPALQSGAVDIVAHTMTITCARWRYVDFSTVYFNAQQRVLLLRSSPYAAMIDVLVNDGKVCATTGSTSLATVRAIAANLVGIGSARLSVAVPYWTDCLVLLQQGAVAAISTDDSILAGLAAQDPFTKIVGLSLSGEPYGLAISNQHPDFVRFVNAVLARMRSDGQWAAIYKRWIGSPVPSPPAAHYQG